MSPPHEPLSLDPARCRERQRRVLKTLQWLGAERAVLARPEHVQYLTGFRPHPLLTALVSLDAGGRCTLIAPNEVPDNVAADDVRTFVAQTHATLHQDQMKRAAAVLVHAVEARGKSAHRVAVECTTGCSPLLLLTSAGRAGPAIVDIEPELWKLRRKKDDDELALMRRAIACTNAMYARAREIIAPGINELEVFSRLHAAAVEVAGEPLTALGNDYRSNAMGGPPRPRAAEAGELFVLDLGPAYRGYHADNCRTFAVDGRPTDAQLAAWRRVVDVLELVERTVRPGVSCRALFLEASESLDPDRTGVFPHHLGHGVGLYPHEAPHLNPEWDDTFEEGDVFTAEPGLYAPELRAGIRLEQNYRVTATGVERLTEFPLEL